MCFTNNSDDLKRKALDTRRNNKLVNTVVNLKRVDWINDNNIEFGEIKRVKLRQSTTVIWKNGWEIIGIKMITGESHIFPYFPVVVRYWKQDIL